MNTSSAAVTQAASRRGQSAVTVSGVKLTSPGKVLWPDEDITKLDLARYYESVAPVLLRYAGNRPLTLRPFPRGIKSPGFYLKDAPASAPGWLTTFCDVPRSTGRPIHFVVPRTARDLVWLAQFNAIEVHPWLSTVLDPDHPDWMVVDLDPPDASRWGDVVKGAKAFRQHLEAAGLHAFPKLTGSTGMHLMVPLEPVHSFDAVREYLASLASVVQADLPDSLTLDYQTDDRKGRVLVDYAQNARGKNTVAPYSVRPRPGAPVAAPVTWEEIDRPTLRSDSIGMLQMSARLDRLGDLLELAAQLRGRLPPA